MTFLTFPKRSTSLPRRVREIYQRRPTKPGVNGEAVNVPAPRYPSQLDLFSYGTGDWLLFLLDCTGTPAKETERKKERENPFNVLPV